MNPKKPLQQLVLIAQSGTAPDLAELIESPQRRYRVTPFSPASLPISVSALLLWVSAKRSVSKDLRASLRSLNARGVTPPVLVYLEEGGLYRDDPELLELLEQEVRALLEQEGFAANEVAFFYGEERERLLDFLDEALPARDSALEGFSRLAQMLCSLGQTPIKEGLSDLLQTLYPKPPPLYWLEMLQALQAQAAKKVELGFVGDWSFFQALSQSASGLPLHCALYPYALGGAYPYTPRRTFFLVYQNKPLAVLLSSSSYELRAAASLGTMGHEDEFEDAARLTANQLFQQCEAERLPIQGHLYRKMQPRDAVVWMARHLHEQRLSDRTTYRAEPGASVAARKGALSGRGRPSSKVLPLQSLEAELRLLLAPRLKAREPLVERLFTFLTSLFSESGAQAEARAWFGAWTYLLGDGNHLWTVMLPEREWVVAIFFEARVTSL